MGQSDFVVERRKQGPKRHKPWPIQKLQLQLQMLGQLQTVKTVAECQESFRLLSDCLNVMNTKKIKDYQAYYAAYVVSPFVYNHS